MSVVDKIQHYQRSLERCPDDDNRTLHCIEKLYRLPVTVQHLQETGVGRTVNALRKYDGSIGDAAKALVAKWKTMVVDEDTSDGEDDDETCVPDVPEGYGDHSNSPKPEKKDQEATSRNSSKHRSSESREKHRSSEKHESRHKTKNSSSENSKPRENEGKTSRETSDDGHKYSKNGIDKRQSKNNDKSETDKSLKHRKETKNENSRREVPREEKTSRNSNYTDKTTRVKVDEKHKSSSGVSRNGSNNSHSELNRNQSKHDGSRKKRSINDSSSEREMHKKRKNEELTDEDRDDDDENDDDDDDRPTQILPRYSGNESGKVSGDSSSDSNSDDDTINQKIKRERSESPAICETSNSKTSHKMSKSSKSKSRENLEKSSSSSTSSRHDSEKRERSKNSTVSSEHRKSEKRKDDANGSSGKESSSSNSKSQSRSSSSSKDHHKSKDRDEARKSSKSRDSKSESSNSKERRDKFKEPKEKKVKKTKVDDDGGIDCNSGASFAEALGMCQDRPSSRKKSTTVGSSPLIKTIKTEPGTSSTPLPSVSKTTSVKVKSEYSTTNESNALSLLAPNVKLEPLSVDLASTLPEISPNYKPLPAHYSNPVHRKQDEDKALDDAIYAKVQRTKVYSGNKSGYTSVPTLCEVCIRVLIQHMDALGFTGGIPYDILKPVLERAMPDQLFTLENYNPYLIEDTDSLWQFHCNREFRDKQREEMESWRDMYMRCRDEREVKLKALTANIKESIDKSVPVRSTKLAYVDNIVKPPRNVLRNQAKYGTAKSSTASSDLKKQLILSGGSNAATNISVPPPPMSRVKTSSSTIAKKNKAPLMAKALQQIKARYKR